MGKYTLFCTKLHPGTMFEIHDHLENIHKNFQFFPALIMNLNFLAQFLVYKAMASKPVECKIICSSIITSLSFNNLNNRVTIVLKKFVAFKTICLKTLVTL